MKRYMTIIFTLLCVQKLSPWLIPYTFDATWNKGNKTYLLVDSKNTGRFGAFENVQDFNKKTGNKLKIIQGEHDTFFGYSFIETKYQDASALKGKNIGFVWVNEKDILQGFKKRGTNPQQTIHLAVVTLFKEMEAKKSPVSGLYTPDGVRKTWGAALNGTWDHFFTDTIYANKPTTKGFEKYYCFMNTYPDGAIGLANQGSASIKLGLYYDKKTIGNPVHTWKHAESYYQAMKKVYPDKPYDKIALEQVLAWDSRGEIMNIYSAYKGRISGIRQDWQTINLYIMLDLVRAKFMQNKTMRDILLGTGAKYIVEETTDRSDKAKDSFFGNAVGSYDSTSGSWITDPTKQPGMGSNILGQILMHVRKELNAGKLLPLTLYTEPEDFFRAQKGMPFKPKGTSWNYAPSDSALKEKDMPLLVMVQPQPSDSKKLIEALINLNRILRQLVQIII